MSLNDKLTALREASRGKLPEEHRRIMSEALQRVEATGQHRRALQEGSPAPDFCLEDHAGRAWSSAELRDQGPLVINFYRGSW